jgi:hypothetical protein
MLIDEAARVNDDLYKAVRPFLAAPDGDLCLMSTPVGKRGFFYEEWANGGPRWKRFTVTAMDCPRIRREFFGGREGDDGGAVVPAGVHVRVRGCGSGAVQPGCGGEGVLERREADAFWPLMNTNCYLGLDLGQKGDYTAIAVVEEWEAAAGGVDMVTFEPRKTRRLDLRYLERIPLGT